MTKRIIAAALILSINSSVVLAGWFGPKDFDECILKSMQGVTSNAAARAIYDSCRKKFPENVQKKQSRKLDVRDVLKLTGRTSLSDSGYFSGDIYNGNEDTVITELSIDITTFVGEKKTTKTYVDDAYIKPRTTGHIGMSIILGDKNTKYSWFITGAKGYSN